MSSVCIVLYFFQQNHKYLVSMFLFVLAIALFIYYISVPPETEARTEVK